MSRDDPQRPTDLRFVGPATATVFESASFVASDVADRRVSFLELVDAGIAPDVADRLRREYSLLWSYEWEVGGADLPRRAERIGNLGPEERAWIAESPSSDGVPARLDDVGGESGGRALDGEDDEASIAAGGFEDATCPRCDEGLDAFVLDDSRTVHCEACGFAGVETG